MNALRKLVVRHGSDDDTDRIARHDIEHSEEGTAYESNGYPYPTDTATTEEGCEIWPACGCPIDRCETEIVRKTPGVRLVLKIMCWATGLAGVIALLMAVLAATDAKAHDALPTAAKPLGWKYPYLCCSDMDCRQVQTKVKETPQGYVVPSGEVIAMTDTRIKESPDGLFHWCTVAGEDTSRTICLFVPSRGF